jgi:radical SAM protein with 4Fe4S-binding SPASM domain
MGQLSKVIKYVRVLYHWQIKHSLDLTYLPEEISLEATNVCNFKCVFCPQSDPSHHQNVPRTYLLPTQADKIFRALRSGGVTTSTLHWTLDGEPFMNRRFAELCQVAIDSGFTNMYFATNGLLLDSETMAALPANPQTRYTFTIDYTSDEKYFERIRGTKGSWDKIRSNIQNILSNADLRHIFVEMQDITSYETLDTDTVERRFRELVALFKDPYGRIKFYHKTFHNAAGLVAKLVETSSTKRYHLCPYPWTSLSIASNGDVVACCRDLRRQTVLGNILEQSLPDIWRGKKFQKLRKDLIEENPAGSAACDGCDLPYDDAKFSWQNLIRVARGRLQIFN